LAFAALAIACPPAAEDPMNTRILCISSSPARRGRKGASLRKCLLGLSLLSPLAAADQGFEISALTLYKDYNGSVEKRSGLENQLKLSRKFNRLSLGVGYQYATAERFQPGDLRVTKMSVTVGYALREDTDWSITYLEINDNLAPTDGGRIYSTTLDFRRLPRNYAAHLAYHYSDYDSFHVAQLDASINKRFQLQGMGFGMTTGVRYMDIGREGNPRYVAHAEHTYLAPHVMLSVSKQGYYSRIGFIGRRAFEVLDGGRLVSHHAMEIRRSYLAAFGRKWDDFDLQFMFGHHLATELPPANDLHINTFALRLDYRF